MPLGNSKGCKSIELSLSGHWHEIFNPFCKTTNHGKYRTYKKMHRALSAVHRGLQISGDSKPGDPRNGPLRKYVPGVRA